MKLNQIAKNLALAGMLSSLSITAFAAAQQQDATPATREANQALYRKLPFADKTDFNNAHQGFIAPLPPAMLKGDQGTGQISFRQRGRKGAGHRQSQPVATVTVA